MSAFGKWDFIEKKKTHLFHLHHDLTFLENSARLQLYDFIFPVNQVMAPEGNLSGAVSLKTSFIETCGTIDHLQ